MKLIMDGHHGQYIPQLFATVIHPSQVNDEAKEDLQALLLGPDEEGYWDAWERVLWNFKTPEGYTLWQSPDGDLFAIAPGEEVPEW